MKNILFILVLLLVISCKDSNVKNTGDQIVLSSGNIYETYEWKYKNHSYVIVKCGNGTLSITHAGHCSCNLNQ